MGEAVRRKKCYIDNIPVIIWGEETTRAYIYVHGKMANKEIAENFARIGEQKGYQTISFDLPMHGERAEEGIPCDIWNGCNTLKSIVKYGLNCWESLSLYACSLGAHFSLYAYQDIPFASCLFQSPIVNMDDLIQVLFHWYQIDEQILKERKVIETPFHTLTWDYYSYLKENPITKWNQSTSILYAANDELQSLDSIQEFVARYHCHLTIAEHSNHGFSDAKDVEIEKDWLKSQIQA